MAKTIAILNHKGGVGKTTTAINLGDALRNLKKKVLLVDLDPQCNASYIMGFDATDGQTVFEALIDKTYNTPLPRYEHSSDFDITPANTELSDIDSYLDNRRIGVNKVLKKLLVPCQEAYDYIIIDCPPSLGILTINAMTAADSIIVPINRQLAILGMAELINKVEEVKEDNERLFIEGYLLTDYDNRLRAVKTTKKAIEDNREEKIFNARIRHNEALTYMVEKRQSIFEYDPNANGAQDYLQLAREISGSKVKPNFSK